MRILCLMLTATLYKFASSFCYHCPQPNQEWKYMAKIYSGSFNRRGGGVLVSSRYILTDCDVIKNTDTLYIILGDSFRGILHYFNRKRALKIPREQIRLSPKTNILRPRLALIRLPANKTNWMTPVTLPPNQWLKGIGLTRGLLYVTYVDLKRQENTFEIASLVSMTNSECQRQRRKLTITSWHVCAKRPFWFVYEKSPLNSGNPLLRWSNNNMVLLGITTNKDCCYTTVVLIKVEDYLVWINKIIYEESLNLDDTEVLPPPLIRHRYTLWAKCPCCPCHGGPKTKSTTNAPSTSPMFTNIILGNSTQNKTTSGGVTLYGKTADSLEIDFLESDFKSSTENLITLNNHWRRNTVDDKTASDSSVIDLVTSNFKPSTDNFTSTLDSNEVLVFAQEMSRTDRVDEGETKGWIKSFWYYLSDIVTF